MSLYIISIIIHVYIITRIYNYTNLGRRLLALARYSTHFILRLHCKQKPTTIGCTHTVRPRFLTHSGLSFLTMRSMSIKLT